MVKRALQLAGAVLVWSLFLVTIGVTMGLLALREVVDDD